MGRIKLRNIEIFANHGCLKEEEKIGSKYLIQLEVKVDFDIAANKDTLKDALDYGSLYKIIEEEMGVRSNLLENVAYRIINRLFKQHPSIKKALLEVEKQNPPVGGNVEGVSVIIKKKRN